MNIVKGNIIKMEINKLRISSLKSVLEKKGVDFYIVPTADFHNSEYVSDYFKVREFLSGFSGSAGTLVVGKDESGLWTDGRYFVQAEKELTGSDVVLYKMGEEGVPTLEEYLDKNVKPGQTIGFDGRVVSAAFGEKLEKMFSDKNVTFLYEEDMADEVWTDRPDMPVSELWVVKDELSGKSAKTKLKEVREVMKKEGAAHLMISKLDDVMWLYNIRANDVECNPVALSYTFISEDEATLFIQEKAVTSEAKEYLTANGVVIRNYDEVISFIDEKEIEGKIWCSSKNISYLFLKLLQRKAQLVDLDNPTTIMKAVKNQVEMENIRKYYLLDSVTLTKFLFWMKENAGKIPMDEISVAEKLDGMRAQMEGFLDLSFPTISAYKSNAAMAHYSATPEEKATINAEGFYLVDSGAQYVGATTDVTRTIALGEISDEMKLHFTKVACGMLRVANAKFLQGCTGRNLDIIARGPLWDCGLDYKHGTGHGIGYILNVHEGPHSLRWQYIPGAAETKLEEGMIVSDEPGMYVEGSHGIRTENIVEVVKESKNEYGQFMGFRHLTYVPIDLDAIDTKYMEESDIRLLNEYHAEVYKRLEPFFEGDEKELLKRVTAQI